MQKHLFIMLFSTYKLYIPYQSETEVSYESSWDMVVVVTQTAECRRKVNAVKGTAHES